MMIIKGLLILIVMVIVPLMVGDIITVVTRTSEHTRTDNLMFRYIMGYVTMWAVFEVVAVPLIVMKKSFMTVVYIWGGVIGLVLIVNIIKQLRKLFVRYYNHKLNIKSSQCNQLTNVIGKNNIFTMFIGIITILIIAYQCFNYIHYMHIDEDDSRFIVNAVEAYDNNTMLLNNPATGEYEGLWVGELVKDVTSPWMIYIALLSKIIHIHPTIFAHTILPTFLLLIAYASYWLLAKRLFNKDDMQSACIFVMCAALINTFFNASVYTESTFLLTRVWQGKAVVAGVMIPVIVYLLYSLHQHSSSAGKFILIGLANTAMCLLSGIGILFGALLTVVYGLWYMIIKKKWFRAFGLMLTCIPNGIFALIYMMLK